MESSALPEQRIGVQQISGRALDAISPDQTRQDDRKARLVQTCLRLVARWRNVRDDETISAANRAIASVCLWTRKLTMLDTAKVRPPVTSKQRKVLVTGDVVLDRQVYVGPENAATGLRGTRLVDTGGGTWLGHDLLQAIANLMGGTELKNAVHLGIEPENTAKMQSLPEMHCFANYRVQVQNRKELEKKERDRVKVWRAVDALGYGTTSARQPSSSGYSIGVSEWASQAYDLWVIDDANRGFRQESCRECWPTWSDDQQPQWIIHKMCRPYGTGDLWRALVAGDLNAKKPDDRKPSLAKSLIAVVSIQDLRADGAFVSRGLSWERSLSDVVRTITLLDRSQSLMNLRKARFVVVGFGAEGAIVIDTQSEAVRLIFDLEHTEGEWIEKHFGQVFGLQTVLTSGIAAALLAPRETVNGESMPGDELAIETICRGVRAGLAGVRHLVEGGHGLAMDLEPGWPLNGVATAVAGKLKQEGPEGETPFGEFAATLADAWLVEGADTWRMIDQRLAAKSAPAAGATATVASTMPHYGKARLVAQFGLTRDTTQVPSLTIGGILSVDRKEMESLRTIKQLVQNYERGGPQKRPLCLGVFGQPGCGKSFGVKELSKAFLSHDVPILEFNLSQCESSEDIIDALHRVRDEVLQGKTPVMFWDEFDSQGNKWLRFLLAPMQDGKFRSGPLEHTIGKCIFVFAGGTSYDFNSFGPPACFEDIGLTEEHNSVPPNGLKERFDNERQEFIKQKGPDFKSRLNGFLDVAGPNQRQRYVWVSQRWTPDETDIGFPIRRAILLRKQLGIGDNDPLDIDSGLLNALLLIDYRHGARSMEKIVEQMKALSGGKRLQRSHLPPQDVLALHLNVKEFEDLLDAGSQYLKHIQRAAPLLHDNYRTGTHRFQAALRQKADCLRKRANELSATDTPQAERLNEQANGLQFDADNAISADMDIEFESLPWAMQEENIAQARRIPELLSVVQLEIVPDSAVSAAAKPACIEDHIEVLSEFEHILWMEKKLRDGWRIGTVESPEVVEAIEKLQCSRKVPLAGMDLLKERIRIRKKCKLHPCLVSYAQLPEPEKDKDRNLITHLNEILQKLDFRVVRRSRSSI